MPTRKINITEEALKLLEPFAMTDLAHVGDLAVSLYVCQGALAWHRHLDYDELFLVHNGMIVLESEWGSVTLRPDELAVVPKGIAHRSVSMLWSIILLLHIRIFPDRRNGDRRVHALRSEKQLAKINVLDQAKQITRPFVSQDLAQVDDFALRLFVAHGSVPWRKASQQTLLLVQQGRVDLFTRDGISVLNAGEMVVLAQSTAYRLVAGERAVVLSLSRLTRTNQASEE
jgi:homogentisate 1,2-dioxygenase